MKLLKRREKGCHFTDFNLVILLFLQKQCQTHITELLCWYIWGGEHYCTLHITAFMRHPENTQSVPESKMHSFGKPTNGRLWGLSCGKVSVVASKSQRGNRRWPAHLHEGVDQRWGGRSVSLSHGLEWTKMKLSQSNSTAAAERNRSVLTTDIFRPSGWEQQSLLSTTSKYNWLYTVLHCIWKWWFKRN